MFHEWRQFFHQPIVWVSLVLALICNLVTWGILLYNIRPQENLVVLHYTLYFGVDKVGQWVEALLLPSLGLLLIAINVLFAAYLSKRAKVASHFFLATTPIHQILLFFAALFIIIANISTKI